VYFTNICSIHSFNSFTLLSFFPSIYTLTQQGCLYSFDAEPNTKVIAPIGTTFWISLGALNRLRRTDPSKVEPLWHSQYAIHHSWFGDDSAFSILQHTGTMGFLLDIFLDKAPYLHFIIVLAALALSSPLINFSVNRLLCSPLLWNTWPSWARFVHSALPLKLLLVQMTYKYVYHLLDKLRKNVRAYLVEMECANLESTVPLTTGPGSEIEEDGDDDDDFVNHVDGIDDPFDDDDDDEDEEEEEDIFDED